MTRGSYFNLERKRRIKGFLFVLPWLIGFIFFVLIPFIQTVQFSLSDLDVKNGIQITPVGFKNYESLLMNNPSFVRDLTATLTKMVNDVPLIMIVSTLLGLMLNVKFKGRLFFRAVVFLPVAIYGSVVANYLTKGLGDAGTMIYTSLSLQNIFEAMQIPQVLATRVQTAVLQIFDVSWRVGIQVLVYLASLQSIPVSMREAAYIEGCNAWDFFWKITVKVTQPALLINLIFTIIEVFKDGSLMQFDIYAGQFNYSMASATTLIFTVAMFLILGLAVLLFGRNMYSRE